ATTPWPVSTAAATSGATWINSALTVSSSAVADSCFDRRNRLREVPEPNSYPLIGSVYEDKQGAVLTAAAPGILHACADGALRSCGRSPVPLATHGERRYPFARARPRSRAVRTLPRRHGPVRSG